MKAIFKVMYSLVLFFVLTQTLFSQDESINTETEKAETAPIEKPSLKPGFLEQKKTSSFGFYFGTGIIISHPDAEIGPPSGIAFNFGGEYEYAFAKKASFNPSLDFSLFHYGWTGKRAAITEIENRTALTLTFTANFPIIAVFKVKNWIISLGGGAAFLLRAGVLEQGVQPEEKSNKLTAAKGVTAINRYFWQNGHFFYPSFMFKTEYTFTGGWKTGMQLRMLVPIFNAWDKMKPNFFHDMLIQLSVIIHPAGKI